MTKVVHLSSAHPAFDERIFEKECKTLRSVGYEVVLVVPHSADEVRDGIRIRSAGVRPSNRIARFTTTLWRVYRAALHENGQIYHFHDPDLMPVGLLLKLHGKRVIYDVHEMYPKSMLLKEWLPWPLRWATSKIVSGIEWFTAAMCDRVVAASPGVARQFPPAKTVMVGNYPDSNFARAAEEESQHELVRKPRGRIAYVGLVSLIRGVETMIDAIGLLPEELEPELIIAGTFSEGAEAAVKAKPGWRRVRQLGQVPRTEIPTLLRSARLGLCLFLPIPNHVEAQPNKLFEYMAGGLPVVASDFPLWRQFVQETKSGLLVQPDNPADVANAIAWLLAHPKEAEEMGRNGQHAVRQRFNWETDAKKLIAAYAEIQPA